MPVLLLLLYPDQMLEYKVAEILQKLPKQKPQQFVHKSDFLKIAPKVTQMFGLFCKKIC